MFVLLIAGYFILNSSKFRRLPSSLTFQLIIKILQSSHSLIKITFLSRKIFILYKYIQTQIFMFSIDYTSCTTFCSASTHLSKKDYQNCSLQYLHIPHQTCQYIKVWIQAYSTFSPQSLVIQSSQPTYFHRGQKTFDIQHSQTTTTVRFTDNQFLNFIMFNIP